MGSMDASPQTRDVSSGWNAEYKFGPPRSELYGTSFGIIDEDINRLIQAVVPNPAKHQEIATKLRELKRLCDGWPSYGWVQSQDNRVLLRFLLARQLNVQKALEMLQNTLQWRQRSGVSNVLPLWDKALHERFDRYFKCLAVTGTDHDGDLVAVERCGKVFAPGLAKCSEEFLQRHVMYNAECFLASLERNRQQHWKEGRCGAFQATAVIDLEGIDMSIADRRLLTLSKVIGRIEADNYPEVLKRVIVVRAPWFFPAIFQMIKPFMDPGTVAKILMPKQSETREVLLRHLPARCIPEELGGSFPMDRLPPGGDVPQDLVDKTFR